MPTVGVVIPYSPRHTPSEMLEEAKASVRDQPVETELYVITDEEQRGPAWARNKGLDRANERYVAFLDADDLWRDDKLALQLDTMQSECCGLCVEGDPELETDEFIRDIFRGELVSLTSSILVDTDQVSVRFEETLPRKEDHLFMLEAASQAGVCLCPDLVTVRKHEGGLSAEGEPRLVLRARRQYVRLARQRVPEVEPYFDAVAAGVWFGSARLFHYRGEYERALRAFWRSGRHRLSPKILPAVGLVFLHWLSPLHPLDEGDGDILTQLWHRYKDLSDA